MSLLTVTIAYLAADLVYGLVRESDLFPMYGQRSRLIEASFITAVVMAWGWLIAPDVFNPSSASVVGLLVYGVVSIPVFAVFWFFGRASISSIGLGGLLSIFPVSLVLGLNAYLLDVPASGFSDALTIPFVAGNAPAIFAGAYIAVRATDNGRGNQKKQRERKRILSSPTADSSIRNTNANRNEGSSPGGHEANDAVVAEGATTDGESEAHSVTGGSSSETTLRNLTHNWQYSQQRFSDIGGYDEAKADLERRVIKPLLAHRDGDDRFSRFSIEPESGIMLYGPPGTGKTMFARALAGELTVPFVELSPADVTSMWINESSDRVKTLFDGAEQLGSGSGSCVIFLDEAEHLFRARDYLGTGAHAEDQKVTSEFLARLTHEDREAIVVAATNRPGDIDQAILRPRRLAAHFEIGLPDEDTRSAILRTHVSDVPSSISNAEYAALATHTAGMTGADLANLVGEARRNAATRDARVLTREDFPPIEDLQVTATEMEPEIDELPTIDGKDDDDDPSRDPDVAVWSNTGDAKIVFTVVTSPMNELIQDVIIADPYVEFNKALREQMIPLQTGQLDNLGNDWVVRNTAPGIVAGGTPWHINQMPASTDCFPGLDATRARDRDVEQFFGRGANVVLVGRTAFVPEVQSLQSGEMFDEDAAVNMPKDVHTEFVRVDNDIQSNIIVYRDGQLFSYRTASFCSERS
ncbi:AAA family ATPase [Haloquadratum walsbyi]|jgi:ATPases of the AAA+ class|uniref:ATPase of the AAA+ class n=1 Tax=Haloquadratum walsbyi J07HQW2 TaxID=1238425 RepID=U1NK45_9EURY|nr:AAA family ATPase [Haloquadratum walsbyi]ERG97333.1 MAG: ATPase of the AAA+ class [Haloquadratum walsbyi J07HQW2]